MNNKVYTKTGDKGRTSLMGGIRISKSDVRLEAYGTVDELNAQLGVLVTLVSDDDKDVLERIQNTLFVLGCNLATDQSKTPLHPAARLSDEEILYLENEIDRIQELLPPMKGFVLPGGSPAAAQSHVCRTVCRRAERRIVSLMEIAVVDQDVMKYLNRLSDYLFVFSRKLNFIVGTNEKIWCNACKSE